MERWFEKLKIKTKKLLKGFTVHDYWHVIRVCNLCEHIGRKEKADLDILRAAALLHDIYAEKDYINHPTKISRTAEKILESVKFPRNKIENVIHCLRYHETYYWYKERIKISKEAKVLQDADRLESIGAIGIARTFTFNGDHHIPIWIPKQKIDKNWNYRKYSKTAITHFYEKLLRMKEGMNTSTGRNMAEKRHKFIEDYLKEFFKEWEGKL